MPHMPSAPNARRHHLAHLVRAPPCVSCPRITSSLCAAEVHGVHSSILQTCPILHPCWHIPSIFIPVFRTRRSAPHAKPCSSPSPQTLPANATPQYCRSADTSPPASAAAVLLILQQARHQPPQPAKHLPCTAGLPHQPAVYCSAGAHRTLLCRTAAVLLLRRCSLAGLPPCAAPSPRGCLP